jgi:hypothetical protein
LCRAAQPFGVAQQRDFGTSMSGASDESRDLAVAPRWWSVRRAQNLKPATYRCPLCDRSLHAMSEHALITPEGDASRRRHAHIECVAAAHRAGELPTLEEWRATQPRRPSLGARLLRRS